MTARSSLLNTRLLNTSSNVVIQEELGNLRTATKFTTTTSADRERTGTRTSVSAGKRKLKMQSIGRSTTTTLNVNKQVESSRTVMFVRNKVFSQRRRLKRCKILFYKPYVYFHCFGKRDIPIR